MSISASVQLDLLWKKIGFGVTETQILGQPGGKAANQESIASPIAILNTQVWQQADQIPVPARTLTSISQSLIATLSPDGSVTTKQAWIAYSGTTTTRLTNFIPFTLDPAGYSVHVYTGTPFSTSNELLPGVSGFEWVFDYSAGVLYFPNTAPTSFGTLYLTVYYFNCECK